MDTTQPNTLLKYALSEMAQLINREKMNPQEALTKVSQNLSLSPNFIKLASSGINVALHYNHFKKNANARDVDFPITRSEQTIKDLFNGTEKTANDIRAELEAEVAKDEQCFNFDRAIYDANYKQAYLQIVNADAKNDSFPMSTKGIFEKSALYIDRLEKKAEDIKTEKVGLHGMVNSLFTKMAAEFSKDSAARIPFEEFEKQAYSLHGEKAVPYLDLIYKTAATQDIRGKHDDKYVMFEPAYLTGMFGDFIKAAESLSAITVLLKDAEESLAFEKQYVRDTYKMLGETKMDKTASLLPELQEIPSDLSKIEDPVLKCAYTKMQDKLKAKEELKKELVSDEKEKKAGEEGHGVLSKLYDAFLQGDGNKDEKMQQDMEKDNLSRKLMLEDLMTTDPIVSQMKPEQVITHYSQMMNLSPELSKEKEVVRSALRLAGSSQAMTPFDAQQLIEADTSLQKQRAIGQGKPVEAPKA